MIISLRSVLRTLVVCLVLAYANKATAQVPLAYYDFEDNNNRNTTVETTLQEGVSTIGSPSVSGVSLTQASGTGNGLTYAGPGTGYALGYYGFTTNTTPVSTDPAIKLGPFNTTGFSTLSVYLELKGIGALSPTNARVYYSNDDVNYTAFSTAISVNQTSFTAYSSNTVSGSSTFYIKIVGYSAGSSPSASDGVLLVDNFTLRAATVTSSTTLININNHGTGLSSGGTYRPPYGATNINGSGITVNTSGGLIMSGNLTLTNGTLVVNSDTLAFQGASAIVRNGTSQLGQITLGTSTILAFGRPVTTNTSTITIPDNVFTNSSPLTIQSLYLNKSSTTTSVTLNTTHDLLITGDLNVTVGRLNDNDKTITVNGNIIGAGNFYSTGTGIGKILLNTAGSTVAATRFGNIEFNNAGGFSAASSFTVSNTMTLTNGAVTVGANILTFITADLPIARTSGTLTTSATSGFIFGTTGNTGGAAFTLPDNLFTSNTPQINGFTVNRTNGIVWNNQEPVFNGTLTLTAGTIDFSGRTVTFQIGNTPISRSAGSITTNSTTSLIFGTTGNTGGNAATIPASAFTTSPVPLNNLTINRTNSITLNNQPLAIAGNLNLTAGTLVDNGQNISVAGNVTGTGTESGVGGVTITGVASTIAGVTIANPIINSTGTVTLVNNLTVATSLTLTTGELNVASNTLILSSEVTPVSRTNGTITVTNNSSLSFGTTGTGTFTLPDDLFTTAPSLKDVIINRSNTLTWNNQNLTINGTLTLTAGSFNLNAISLIFQNSDAPIARTGGNIITTTSSNIIFGTAGNTAGAAFTIPASAFSGIPSLNNLVVNRDNTLTFNGSLTINGTLSLVAGSLDMGTNTLTFINGDVPIARTAGSLVNSTTAGSIVFGTAGNTGGAAFTIPNNVFSSGSFFNITLNRTNELFWNNQDPIINGTLTLTAGVINFGDRLVTFQTASTPIARNGTSQLGTITFGTGASLAFGSVGNTGGNAFTVPASVFTTAPTLQNLTINKANTITWNTQDLTINGKLTLTLGSFNISTITLTFQNGDTPIERTSGNIVTSTSNNLVFGTPGNTAGAAFTIPASTFSTAPTVTNFTVNRTNDLTLSQALTVRGTLTLINGKLDIGTNNLTFILGDAPIVRTTGTLEASSSAGTITFGTTNNTTGAAFTIPDGTFADVNIYNLTVNRTNSLTWNNQDPIINGTLTLTAGVIDFGNRTLTFQNNNTPIARGTGATGTITLGSSANLVFGTTGNTGGNAFTIPGSSFTTAPSINSFTINRTNTLTFNSQTLALSGNLNLTAGTLSAASAISVAGNITGTGTKTGGTITMTTGGTTISGATLSSVDLSNAGGFSLSGSPTITGTLTLTTGQLTVGNNTLTFHSGNTPIARNGTTQTGNITLSTTSNLAFGIIGSTGGNAFTIPASTLLPSSPEFQSLTINRTNSLTMSAQVLTLNGNLNLTAGTLSAGSNINLLGNITGTGTKSGNGTIIMTGAGATISGATINNLQLDNLAGFSLTGSPTISNVLTLLNGSLAVGANTLTFHTGNTPIARNGTTQTGTINLSATSSLVFGTSVATAGNAFTIPNNTFSSTTPEFLNFSVNRTNSLTLNNQNFALKGLLQLSAGTLILPSNYVFTLRSTSISNTAMVDQLGATAAIQYATGATFKVERYIPRTGSGIRAYRDIAPSVNSGTGTLFTNWQESGTNGLENGIYYGTHITGVAGGAPGGVDATTGLDKTQSAAISVSSMVINTTSGNSEWVNQTSTKLSNDTLSAFKGYRILIRGNRMVNLYQNPTPTTMNAAAILRSTGKLITGDVVYSTSGITANGGTNTGIRLNSGSTTGFTMLGNPYAAPIIWDSLVANSSNIQSTYWLFDPNVGASGGYVTYNALTGSSLPSSSAANKYIQPGQAFFIKNNNSLAPALTIRERHKAASAANLTLVFRNSQNTEAQLSRLNFTVKKNISGRGMVALDGAAVVYRADFSNNIGAEDGSKINNSAENLSIITQANNLSIDGRQNATINDTIQLRVWNTSNGAYTLEIDPTAFTSNGLQAYLLDRFNNSQTTLSMTAVNTYAFTVSADTMSSNRRFKVVFKSTSTLPVTFYAIKADKQNDKVKVSWDIIEKDINNYEVQRSANGGEFVTINKVAAQNSSNNVVTYQSVDAAPLKGNNYYRIKANENNGNIAYSSVALVVANSKEAITVYPNPIKGKVANILFSNVKAGKYNVAVFAANGQEVYNSTLTISNTTENRSIMLPARLQTGTYLLKVTGDEFTYNNQLFVD